MIAGATRGAGGSALGAHVASLRGGQHVRMGSSRNLVSDTIKDQVRELTDLASHSRAAKPIYHIHADPPADRPLNAAGWNRYWNRFEAEFGLQRQPFAEQIHVKGGREHRHREYSLVRPDGTTMPLAFDHARREKIGRITEFEEGQALTPGAHNRAVLAALDRDGRDDVAAAMRAVDLDTMARPRAPTTPQDRAQAERTGVAPASIGAVVLTAWRTSDSGVAFSAALEEQGLRIERGSKVAVVVDQVGHVLPLARLLARAVKADGGGAIRAGDVSARISDLDLRQHEPLTGSRRSEEGPAEEGAEPVAAPALAASDPTPKSPAKPIAADFHTGVLDVVQSQPAHHSHAHVQSGRGREGPAEIVVHDRPGVGPRRHRGPEDRQGGGPQGSLDEHVWGDASRGDHDGVAALTEPPGADGAGREQDRRGHLPVGDDRGKPSADRIAAGLARIEDRQTELALAARPGALDRLRALARRVAEGDPSIAAARSKADDIRTTYVINALPLDQLARLLAIARRFDPLADAPAASGGRISGVLSREPWPDPASRNRREVANLAKDAIDAAVARATSAAAEARERHREATARIGVLDRVARILGWRTDSIICERAAAADADRLRVAADTLSGSHVRRSAQADADATGTVRHRERERERWLESREVRKPLREAHGNDLVQQGIRSAMPDIQVLAPHGPR